MKRESSSRKWEKYSDKEWKQILRELRNYTKAKCTVLPADVEPDDIASESLKRVLEGSRNWNLEKYPDLLSLLKSTVDSIISKIWKLACSKERMRETKGYTNIEVLEKYESPDAEKREQEQYFEKRLDEIRVSAEGDEDLEEMFLAIKYGCFSRSQIAEYLKWDIKRVDNAIKRLKRRITKKSQQEEGGANE